MSSQVQVGPPNLKEVSPPALAVGNFLRHHKLLKQRNGFLNGKRYDFFRVKRAVRALESEDYKKLQKKNKNLPEITNRQQALEAFRLLPLNKLAFRVDKIDTQIALQNGLKPLSGVPCLHIVGQQEFGDDMYYVWFHEPVKITTYLTAVLAVIGIFAIVLFPLWPIKMRIGVWYISMGLLGLLGLFFVIAIIRLIIFVITHFILPKGLWIFPNLFEDVGFFESFVPLYCWSGDKALAPSIAAAQKAKKRKQIKKKRKQEQEDEKKKLLEEQIKKFGASNATGGSGTPSPVPNSTPNTNNGLPPSFAVPPDFHNLDPTAKAIFTARIREFAGRIERRKMEYVQSGQPIPQTPEEIKAFNEKIIQEEKEKYQLELIQAAQAAGANVTPPKTQKRTVTLEEDSDHN